MGYSEIWAPWRLAYVQSEASEETNLSELSFLPGSDEDCFICQAVADSPENDARRYVLYRGSHVLVIMNRYPYNNGHLLVTPRRHVARLEALSAEEHLELMEMVTKMTQILEKTIHPHGFNVGLNLGAVAGAGLPGHLHWHIVPRWNGDTNFMPVLGSVNVIPQSLEALWEILKQEL